MAEERADELMLSKRKETIGQRWYDARVQIGQRLGRRYSQPTMATEMGVKPGTVRDIEQKQREEPEAGTVWCLMRLLEQYGLEPRDLGWWIAVEHTKWCRPRVGEGR